MANGLLGEILGSVLGGAGAGQSGATGQGGLGDVLGGMLGRGGIGQGLPTGGGSPLGGGRGALLTMLLPMAMQWVQRNGGVGAVLQRFRENGYGQQADSWTSTGPNQQLPPQAVSEVVGTDELSRLSQQLGVDHQEVANGLAEILPQMVDHLTPDGHVPSNADSLMAQGQAALEGYLNRAGAR
jgi:uncharacterized protein YidB (DUF937 family)